MSEVIEIPIKLTQFQLPQAVQVRLNLLLDRQDKDYTLSLSERQEVEGLVELAEFLFMFNTGNQPSLRAIHLVRVPCLSQFT